MLSTPRPTEQAFDRVVERALSRRGFLGGVLAFGSGAAVMGSTMLSSPAEAGSRFGFPEFSGLPLSTSNAAIVRPARVFAGLGLPADNSQSVGSRPTYSTGSRGPTTF